MGEWENGRMGEWENGRMEEWESGRILLRSLSYAGHGGGALAREDGVGVCAPQARMGVWVCGCVGVWVWESAHARAQSSELNKRHLSDHAQEENH
jgi:hypothetical protein